MSPFASFSTSFWRDSHVSASFSQAAQFADVSIATSIAAHGPLLPERSAQAQISLQQMFGPSTRLRVDVYDRQDRDLMYRPLLDPRILDGLVFSGDPLAPWGNSQRARSRGVEIFLQRRSANRLSGWASYAYNSTQYRDAAPSEFDARNSVRVFAMYRLSSTWNFSGRCVYGNGLPIPGFFEIRNGIPYLAAERNSVRLPDYKRTDFRINKAFVKRRAQYTVFAEVVNVTNHSNVVFEALNSFNLRTGQASFSLQRTFPILPAAGIVIDF